MAAPRSVGPTVVSRPRSTAAPRPQRQESPRPLRLQVRHRPINPRRSESLRADADAPSAIQRPPSRVQGGPALPASWPCAAVRRRQSQAARSPPTRSTVSIRKAMTTTMKVSRKIRRAFLRPALRPRGLAACPASRGPDAASRAVSRRHAAGRRGFRRRTDPDRSRPPVPAPSCAGTPTAARVSRAPLPVARRRRAAGSCASAGGRRDRVSSGA